MASSGSKDSGTATESYSKGNEAFVNDDYQGAIDLYSNALGKFVELITILTNLYLHQGLEPMYADALVARAHAYIKTDKYEAAKKDADKAIDILRAGGDNPAMTSKAFLRSGVASFHLGRYREARNCFVEGQKLGEESGLKQWMSWCDEKINKFGDFAPGVKPAPSVVSEEKQNKTDDAKTGDENTETKPAPAVDNNAMPVPKVRSLSI